MLTDSKYVTHPYEIYEIMSNAGDYQWQDIADRLT